MWDERIYTASGREAIAKEIATYERTFVIGVKPMASPRPRKGGRIPESFHNFKESFMAALLRNDYPEIHDPEKDIHWFAVESVFHFRMPQKLKDIDGKWRKDELWEEGMEAIPSFANGDIDNYHKGVWDALQGSRARKVKGIVRDDKHFVIDLGGAKVRTIYDDRIVTTLYGIDYDKSPFRF